MSQHWDNYARLLTDYCLDIQAGQKVWVQSTYLAEPLLKALAERLYQKQAIVEWSVGFEDQAYYKLKYAKGASLTTPSVQVAAASLSFDAIIFCGAPFNVSSIRHADPDKKRDIAMAQKVLRQTRLERGAQGSLKWVICQFPTAANAQLADMSLAEYEDFILNACFLKESDPIEAWARLSHQQQKWVDQLNKYESFVFRNSHFECSLSTRDRLWINSDGKRNMPSGEVFTSPQEASVNGTLFFDFPTMYQGHELQGVRFDIEKGQIRSWSAERGGELLDYIMGLEGARYFGECAIGTNPNIHQATKQILFDEKLSKTVHFAIGSAYPETGGNHQAAIHLDFIASMADGGAIEADGHVIYQDGVFASFFSN